MAHFLEGMEQYTCDSLAKITVRRYGTMLLAALLSQVKGLDLSNLLINIQTCCYKWARQNSLCRPWKLFAWTMWFFFWQLCFCRSWRHCDRCSREASWFFQRQIFGSGDGNYSDQSEFNAIAAECCASSNKRITIRFIIVSLVTSILNVQMRLISDMIARINEFKGSAVIY